MINIMTFNEWKESDDYKINQWFINKKIAVQKWFDEPSLDGLEFDYFEFDTSNSLYELYSAELYFHEKIAQYTLQFLIDAASLNEADEVPAEAPAEETPEAPTEEPVADENKPETKDTVKKIKLVLKGFSIETDEMLGSIEREVDNSELLADLILQLINEFKIEFISEEES